MSVPLTLLLDFTRAEESDDPFAFHFKAQHYILRTAGGGAQSTELSWDQQLQDDLDAVRLPGCAPEVVQRLGELLRRFLKPADWSAYESQILKAVQERRQVVLTIRSAAAELYALPWELLTLKTTGQHLGEVPSLVLRYEWPEIETAESDPASLTEGGRILFAWSAAAGAVPAAEHLAALESACQGGMFDFMRDRDVLPHASCENLVATLTAAQKSDRPISVLHLLCHGSADGQTFGVALDSDRAEGGGGKAVVDAGRLRQLLYPFAGMVRLVVLAACDSGNIGALGNQLGSVAQTLHRAGIAHVVASRFPLSVPGSIRLTESLYGDLLRGPASLEQALCRARQRLAQDSRQLDWASIQLYARDADGADSRPLVVRPYRGLLSFAPEHQRFYFGRDRAVEELLHDLQDLEASGRPRFMVVSGASGIGKTSVVLAGAVPQLTARKQKRRVVQLRPNGDPEALLETTLADLQRPVAGEASGDGGGSLLIVDQFEDIFTTLADAGRRQSFTQKLWNIASDPKSGISIIITLRVDFIGRCTEIVLDATGRRLDSVAYDEAHRVFLTLPGPHELREAITRPAELVGLELEDGLVQRMILDVGSEPGGLALLEDTLDALWQRRKGRRLTQAAYDALGGLSGALQSRAQALVQSFSSEEQQVARRLLVRLVGVVDESGLTTRRSVPLDKLRPEGSQATFDRVLGRLVEARLLVRSGKEAGAAERSGGDSQASGALRIPSADAELLLRSHPPTRESGARVEVAHESLVRKWELLRQWIREDRRMLAELEKLEGWIRQWKQMGTVLVGSQLGYAAEVARRYPHDLPPGTHTLLRLSHQRAQRSRRLRDVILAAAVAAGLVLALLAVTAYREAAQASEYGQLARDALRLGATMDWGSSPDTNMQLLREVERSGAHLPPGWLPLAADTLARADYRDISLGEQAAASGPHAVAMSRDGRRVVGAATDGTALVVSTAGGAPQRLGSPGGGVLAVAFSPDGTRIAIAGADHQLRVFFGDLTAPPLVLDGEGQNATLIAFSPDGTRLAAVVADRTVRQWKVEGGQPLPLLSHGAEVLAIAYSPDGKYLASAGADHLARIFRTDSGEIVRVLGGGAANVLSVAYRPDGSELSTGTADGQLLVWRPSDGSRLAAHDLHDPVVAVAYSPDGQQLAAATERGITIVRSRGVLLASIRRRRQPPPLGLEYSSDGRSLHAVLKGQIVRVLPIAVDEQALRQRFWRLRTCPEPALRQRVLLESRRAAERNFDSCRQMLACLGGEAFLQQADHPPPGTAESGRLGPDIGLAPWSACLQAFQDRQRQNYRSMSFTPDELRDMPAPFLAGF